MPDGLVLPTLPCVQMNPSVLRRLRAYIYQHVNTSAHMLPDIFWKPSYIHVCIHPYGFKMNKIFIYMNLCSHIINFV